MNSIGADLQINLETFVKNSGTDSICLFNTVCMRLDQVSLEVKTENSMMRICGGKNKW